MGRSRLGLALALAVWLLTPLDRAHAQFGAGGVGNDPFSLYFGFYLPNQARIAAQSTPIDTINAAQAARQFSAARDRTGLYDPTSPFAEEDVDPLRPYSNRRERLVRAHSFPTSITNARIRGNTPPLYYNRTAQYYQTLRVGHGPNSNLAVTRSGGRYSGGSFGMPSTNPQAYMNPGPR